MLTGTRISVPSSSVNLSSSSSSTERTRRKFNTWKNDCDKIYPLILGYFLLSHRNSAGTPCSIELGLVWRDEIDTYHGLSQEQTKKEETYGKNLGTARKERKRMCVVSVNPLIQWPWGKRSLLELCLTVTWYSVIYEQLNLSSCRASKIICDQVPTSTSWSYRISPRCLFRHLLILLQMRRCLPLLPQSHKDSLHKNPWLKLKEENYRRSSVRKRLLWRPSSNKAVAGNQNSRSHRVNLKRNHKPGRHQRLYLLQPLIQ